jgi:aminoglycoside phosphotransferase (APT) family kinase protein
MDDLDRPLVERVLGREVVEASRPTWGFTTRTHVVTLTGGDRVVVQRYRHGADAERRLANMNALAAPAGAARIPIPRVMRFDTTAETPWIIFDALPGVPIPEAGERALTEWRFPGVSHAMGDLLRRFRALDVPGLELDDLWAVPARLAAAAGAWADGITELGPAERPIIDGMLGEVPRLFSGRPVVLAHGDYAPVNILTDGTSITGLLDFEAMRWADPLFDVAWWAWAVGFARGSVLNRAFTPFLDGAGIVPDPALPARIRSLQVMRMLELLGGTLGPDPVLRTVILERLREAIRDQPSAA